MNEAIKTPLMSSAHICRKTTLFESLKLMALKSLKTDTQIWIGSSIFNCHMLVLESYSTFFRRNRNEAIIRLPEDKISTRGFTMVYHWMLCDNATAQRTGFIELFRAADFLEIGQLIEQCWVCLDNDQYFAEHEAFFIYWEARALELGQLLRGLTMNRINTFFLMLVSSSEFLEMSFDEVHYLFNSNSLAVNNEMEVLYAIIRWLSSDWQNRQSHVDDLVKCIRFKLIPTWNLGILIRPTKLLVLDRFLTNPRIPHLVRQAILANTLEGHMEGNNYIARSLDPSSPDSLISRCWIYDRNCSYHHLPGCKRQSFVQYTDFLLYLHQIYMRGSNYNVPMEILSKMDIQKSGCCETL